MTRRAGLHSKSNIAAREIVKKKPFQKFGNFLPDIEMCEKSTSSIELILLLAILEYLSFRMVVSRPPGTFSMERNTADKIFQYGRKSDHA